MATLPADTFDASASASSERRYTTVAIILHWVIAAAILFQMVAGKWMVAQGDDATDTVFTVFQIHKTVGLSIFALTLARIVWRLANPAPALPQGMTAFERFAANGAHIGFYVFLIAVPLTGWAMASVSPTGVPTFYLLLEALPFAHLPLLTESGLDVRHDAELILKAVHANLSLAMGLLIALHIAAALKHQFIARDNLIARMVVSARTQPNSVARASIAGIAASTTLMFIIGGIAWGVQQSASYHPASEANLEAAPASAGAWVIDHEQSVLGFTVTYTGNDVAGTIGAWTADIVFNTQDLFAASATVTIDMTSVSLGDATLQAQAAGGDGFDLANHATATYEASNFERLDDQTYVANGKLTLRGISVDAPLSFTFAQTDGIATVSGSTSLNRLDFGVGAVGAADEAWLLYGVDVAFDLTAQQP